MGYLIMHVLSFYIRNYLLSLPELNILGLDPLITEYLILNGLLGYCAYNFTCIHYDRGLPALGSFIYFTEYVVILGILYICVFIFRSFGVSDIVSLLVTLFIALWGNMKLTNL